MASQPIATFGRIPAETARLFQQLVQDVQDKVVPALPTHANAKTRTQTLELVLEIVLRDWRENGNTTGLVADDIQDLRNFITLAASLAGSDLNGSGAPIYQATLRGLLEDWLANWNAPGDPGPPGPIN